MHNKTLNYVVLRASPDPIRFESLNAGVVVFDGERTVVEIDASNKRLPLLHPDLGRIDFSDWANQIQTQLRNVPEEQQHFLLSMIAHPFVPDKKIGITNGVSALEQASNLFERMVGKQKPTIEIVKSHFVKQTKLVRELKDYFRRYKVFSQNIEGLSKHLIVPNYPIDISSDLYADFALKNGKLNVIETLDLRNIERLTPTLRGDAAIKGITLNSADKARKIAVIQASDYKVARPAINLIQNFADDIYDLTSSEDKQRFTQFLAKTLNKPDMLTELQ